MSPGAVEIKPIKIIEARGPPKEQIDKIRSTLLNKFKKNPHREVVETLFPQGFGGWGEWRVGELSFEMGPTNSPLEEVAAGEQQQKVIRQVANEFKNIITKSGWSSEWFGNQPINVNEIHKLFISQYVRIKIK